MTDSPTPSQAAATPRSNDMLELEFTIEPFVEGKPGSHVVAAFDAAELSIPEGATVEIGPFGTTVTGPASVVLECSDRVMFAAFANGATRVSLQVSTHTA